MPYKDGTPTLGEQFEAHHVSEPLDSLEYYRSLQEAEGKLHEAEETIRYMAENCHQAYHQDQSCGWWECQRNICNSAQQALPEYVLWLQGKGPKPT